MKLEPEQKKARLKVPRYRLKQVMPMRLNGEFYHENYESVTDA